MPKIVDDAGQVRPPSELKDFSFVDKSIRDGFLAAFNSSLFYWYLTVYSDCRNLNRRELENFPLDSTKFDKVELAKLNELVHSLMADFKRNSRALPMRYEKLGTLEIQCIYPKLSKPLIDEIDRALAKHYGFTGEELDFIINHDIKYRMGGSDEEE